MLRRALWWTAAFALIALPGEAESRTFLQLMTGDESIPPDARSLALGKTRGASTTGGFTATGNPALLAHVQRLEVAAGGGGNRLKESRSTPAYDSFDGFLVESIYVLNQNWNTDGAFGAAAMPFEEGELAKLGLGVAYSPLWDYRYDYFEQVRDPNAFTQPRDDLIGINDIESNGRLEAWSFGAGYDVHEWLDLGATFQWAYGDHDLLARTWFVRPDSTVSGELALSSLSGPRWTLGGVVTPHHSVSVSGHWRSKMRLEGDFELAGDASYLAFLGDLAGTSTSGEAVVTYPQEVGLGVTWRPRAKVETTIQGELNWRDWSKYENSIFESPQLRSVWDARFGIEHRFYNDMPVRFGFAYEPSPQDRQVTTTSFTFGGGYEFGPAIMDLGFEITNRQYRFGDVFDDAAFGGNTRTVTDEVDETTTGVYATLHWATNTFGS